MSASLPVDVRHLADRRAQAHQSPVPLSIPAQVAGTHLLHVAESSAGAQLAGIVLPPPPPQLHHVPSSPATSVNTVADAYSFSSSGSSTCGGTGYGDSCGDPESLGVHVPAPPTRRMREFTPESKKDDEYWTKRQKNNEAAKRSREKRRANDTVMMRRIHELATENKRLKLELDVLRRQLGLLPTTTESQPPSTAAASTLDATAQLSATGDQLMSRQKLELPASMTTGYDDDDTASSHRSSGAVVMMDQVRGEQKQRPEETHLHHYHPGPPSATEWPTTCSVSVEFSTSSSDARTFASLPAYCRSTSGNFLPSIANLCWRAPLQDNGGGGPRVWSSYRSLKDGDRSASCRAPPLPRTLVDSSPIVIFSDVSSSGDDSVDDSYGRHFDTLRRSVERVGKDGVVELPLNLSTPSRHQSPVLTRHAYGADSGVVRRSSGDFAQVTAPSLPIKTESEPAADQHHGDAVLITRRASYACEPQLSRNCSPEDAHYDQSSRSTSLSSVASVAWQAGFDVAPPQLAADDVPLPVRAAPAADQLPAGGRHVRCGLPLKVRHKLGSASTSRIIIEDAPRPLYSECAAGVTQTGSRP